MYETKFDLSSHRFDPYVRPRSQTAHASTRRAPTAQPPVREAARPRSRTHTDVVAPPLVPWTSPKPQAAESGSTAKPKPSLAALGSPFVFMPKMPPRAPSRLPSPQRLGTTSPLHRSPMEIGSAQPEQRSPLRYSPMDIDSVRLEQHSASRGSPMDVDSVLAGGPTGFSELGAEGLWSTTPYRSPTPEADRQVIDLLRAQHRNRA